MNTFPPMQMAPIDSLVNLETHLKYFKPLSQTSNFSTQNYNYVVVVFWNRFMGRQSKRLIRFVQENINLGIKEKVKIIYVNNDNYFSARLSN